MHCARGEKVPGRQRMSVEALFTVRYEGRSYQVEVSYNPGKSVTGVKKLIVAKLRSNFDGFEHVKAGYLTLKTLDGDVIASDEMPLGKNFLADLDGSLVVKQISSVRPAPGNITHIR